MSTYFITGIGTGIGKTVTSAVLTEKLQADYWKPVQSGDLEISDSLFVRNLISNDKTIVHPERYRLSEPLSPHLSARLDGVEIVLPEIRVPETDNHLVIEGAGGLMVPLNEKELIIDLIKCLNAKTIIVSQNYLGSINHTLLTIEVLKANRIEIEGIVFNGKPNEESERYIQAYSGLKVIGRIPSFATVNRECIRNAGQLLNI